MMKEEKALRWFRICLIAAALSAVAAGPAGREEDGWGTYRNEKYGYELAYPPGMDYFEYAGGSSGDLNETATGNTLIRFEVWPPGECPRQPDHTTAKALGIERAKTVTRTDGPDGSSYCGDPMKFEEFTSSEGVKFFELELTCMREAFPAREDETAVAPAAAMQSVITVEGKKGPTYFADISQSWRKRILLADPVNSRQSSKVTAMSRIDPAVLRKILDTLKTFPIPKPPGICIEDPQNRGRSNGNSSR
jgi:hypothetical protein